MGGHDCQATYLPRYVREADPVRPLRADIRPQLVVCTFAKYLPGQQGSEATGSDY